MRLETLSGVKGLYPASRATRFTGGGDFLEMCENTVKQVLCTWKNMMIYK